MTHSPHPHLIIAGATRAASTSLFGYLGDHPGVVRSSLKETRFFLSEEYPVPRHLPADAPLSDYLTLFRPPLEGKALLEATPDYLFCPVAAGRIHTSLPGARLIFILREPVERLISWYRYARQNNLLDQAVSLDDYVGQQFDAAQKPPEAPEPSGAPDNPSAAQHMLSLTQGRYSEFLPTYFEMFGRERCLVLDYQQVSLAPRQTLKAVCAFAGIDPGFYDRYKFDLLNASVGVRSHGVHAAYKRMAWAVRSKVVSRPLIHSLLRRARRGLYPIYAKLNHPPAGVARTAEVSGDTAARLRAYYRGEAETLTALTGVDFSSWIKDEPRPAATEGPGLCQHPSST